jgi:hypothetical protein
MLPLYSYPLMLLGLLWFWVMLHAVWPSRGALSPPMPAESEPITPTRTHAIAPTPYAGLTQKPPCALGAHEAAPPTLSSPGRLTPMPPMHRRPREVETSRHVCPHPPCA